MNQSLVWQSDVTDVAVPNFREIQFRWFCNLILASMPDDGLEEALESLVRINEFHALPKQLPTPQMRETTRLLKAKIERRTERPAFSLLEE